MAQQLATGANLVGARMDRMTKNFACCQNTVCVADWWIKTKQKGIHCPYSQRF